MTIVWYIQSIVSMYVTPNRSPLPIIVIVITRNDKKSSSCHCSRFTNSSAKALFLKKQLHQRINNTHNIISRKDDGAHFIPILRQTKTNKINLALHLSSIATLSVAVLTMSVESAEAKRGEYAASHTSHYTTEEKRDSYSTLSKILETKCTDESVRQVVLDMMGVCADITDALRVNLVTVEGSSNSFGDSQLSVDVRDKYRCVFEASSLDDMIVESKRFSQFVIPGTVINLRPFFSSKFRVNALW